MFQCAAKPVVEMRPVGGNADGLPVKSGARHWIERPRQPVAVEDHGQRDPLPARLAEAQQEQERIAQADLRQRVFKGEVGARAVHRAQEDAQRDQQERTPDGVRPHLAERAAFGQPAGNRVGQRHAHQKRERRLNHVVQRAAGPLHVRLVVAQETPEPVAGKGVRHARQLQHFGHHQQHHQAAVGVHGDVAGDRLRGADGILRGGARFEGRLQRVTSLAVSGRVRQRADSSSEYKGFRAVVQTQLQKASRIEAGGSAGDQTAGLIDRDPFTARVAGAA